MEYQINGERLLQNLFTMAQFGQNEGGGIDRSLGSKADYDTREWIKSYWQDHLKVEPETDAIANLWAKHSGTEHRKPLVIGSHHDAVPDGGKYDGAMGVLIATEVLETIVEQGILLKHPLYAISFTGEEPNPYNLSTLGSKVISGRLRKEDLFSVHNRETGESLEDTIKRLGGDISSLENARIQPGELAGFLEVHNELGRHLEAQGLHLSGVSTITGIYREEIQVYGENNHAGTTMMPDRKDAFLALSDFAVGLNEIVGAYEDPDVVGTMGYVKVSPNEANIVPGSAVGIIDIRTCERKTISEIVKKLDDLTEKTEKGRRVKIKRQVLLDQPARIMDEDIINIVKENLAKLKEPENVMVSMAGHDASNMQLLTKAGMIFTRSVGGKGHCKEEFTENADVIKAGQLALETILRMDEELP
ncbi:hydantoinase/carbamoylase family amidase [Ruminococcus sp. 2227st1_E6_2227SCRN_220401]|uniref:hydantoinase/carbamoylase family amidase n=1 Tax=unclassified Ruminococcus TaxID=2608920 RepID=UPI00319DCAB1